MIYMLHGDCIELLKTLPDCSVDAVVTDPPYGLKFTGKRWDCSVPSVAVWAECLRVLKPGCHLLAFAGTRTQHRMAVNIEDAGFEIRDLIMWVYGSGFPKSLDVSKAMDRAAGAEREVVGRRTDRAATPKQDARGGNLMGGRNSGIDCSAITAPATEAARQWQGWGAGRTSGSCNFHPTVKPTDLMRYLCRLVTPPDGVVLDPFMGSGSTGKAAVLEGFRFVGMEREAEYIEIARSRIKSALLNRGGEK